MESKKTPSGKVGTCANCGREKFIAGKDGLCSACHYSVKGMKIGDLDYEIALQKAKDRLTNPTHKRGVKVKTKAAAPVKRAKSEISVLDHTINQVARAGIPAIIAQARIELDGLESEAGRLKRAINILESL